MDYVIQSYRRLNEPYRSSRLFSLAAGAAPLFSSPTSYPSYLGVPIFESDPRYMGSQLFGFTNGQSITLRSDLRGALRMFVQLHEEEHVKDMNASEHTIDLRAWRRLVRRKPWTKEDLQPVRTLLHQRWGTRREKRLGLPL